MTLITSRRSFITGLVSLVAAPAIVRVSNLMPVKSYALTPEELLKLRMAEAYRITRENLSNSIYGGWVGYSGNFNVPAVGLDALLRNTTARVCFDPDEATASSWQLNET